MIWDIYKIYKDGYAENFDEYGQAFQEFGSIFDGYHIIFQENENNEPEIFGLSESDVSFVKQDIKRLERKIQKYQTENLPELSQKIDRLQKYLDKQKSLLFALENADE